MRPDREELLQSIYRRGADLRRRRHALLATAAATVVIVAGAGLVAADDGGESRVATEGGPVTSSTTSTSIGDVLERPEGATPNPPTVTSTRSDRLEPAATTTTPAPCRNSTEPRCGDFYFDYPGPNTPPTITLASAPTVIRVDEPVRLTIRYVDPDGAPLSRCTSFWPGEGPPGSSFEVLHGNHYPATCSDAWPPGFGAWDPNPPEAWESTVTVVYRGTPGPRVVEFRTEEGGRCPGGNQADCDRHVDADFPIEVLPAEPPSSAG